MGEVEEDVNYLQFGKGAFVRSAPALFPILFSRLRGTSDPFLCPLPASAEFEDVEFIANATVNLLLKQLKQKGGDKRHPE